MKIGSPIDTQAVAAEAATRTQRTPGAATPALGGVIATDQVEVSAAGSQLGAAGADFDQAKVDAIRQAIKDGRFTVNADAIADRLIADAAALLAPRTN